MVWKNTDQLLDRRVAKPVRNSTLGLDGGSGSYTLRRGWVSRRSVSSKLENNFIVVYPKRGALPLETEVRGAPDLSQNILSCLGVL